jgi:integrase
VAKKRFLTWDANTKRWLKKYRGKMYSVSCRQLGTPPTKEASASAANAWWLQKQAEIDQQAGEPTPLEQMRAAVNLLALVEEFNAADRETKMRIAEAVLGPDRIKEMEEGVDFILATPQDHDRTVGAQVTNWLKGQKEAVAAGQLDPTSYDGYRVNVNRFRDWIGAERSVESITAARLKEFYEYLLGQVAERRAWEQANVALGRGEKRPGMSAKYAKSIFATSKTFICHLAELGLIPLPGNIHSKALRFTAGVKKIKTFEPNEFSALYSACATKAPRTALYLLLMANCGMYQNDISELGEDEVDFKAGTITRPRSKTPNGPVVTYKLWPETIALLKRFRNKDKSVLNERGARRVLVTANGKPLVPVCHRAGRLVRTDNIRSAYRRLLVRLKINDGKPLKLIRKTSATILGQHPQYKFYAQYFLAHSPGSVADKHYVVPSTEEFFAALDWLRQQYGLGQRPERDDDDSTG